jgi:hypothetical protein
MVSSAVNLGGGAGAPFAETAATGDAGLGLVVPFTIAEVMGRAALVGFMTATGLLAAGVGATDSGTELEDAGAKPACLNSTDFKLPRVAMIQSVSPKRVRSLVLRNPCFVLQRA